MLAAIGTILWVIVSGLFSIPKRASVRYSEGSFSWSWDFVSGLGGAALIEHLRIRRLQQHLLLGGEVRNPSRNIPFAVICLDHPRGAPLHLPEHHDFSAWSPWRDAMASQHVVSDFMEIVYGSWAARILTFLVLGASAASVFALLLGYSRIPYAAAKDKRFFAVSPSCTRPSRFPHVSLLTLGLASTIFCFFDLGNIIQSADRDSDRHPSAGAGGRRDPDSKIPARYPPPLPNVVGYPVPSLAGRDPLAAGADLDRNRHRRTRAAVLALGIGVYMLRARQVGEWPFGRDPIGES